MVGARHAADPSSEAIPQAVLGGTAIEKRNLRLRANNALEGGNHIEDHLPQLAQSRLHAVATRVERVLGLRQDQVGQRGEGLRERRVGDEPLVLVELAFGEQTSSSCDGRVRLAHEAGFTNARIALNQQEQATSGGGQFKGAQNAADFGIASVEPIRNAQVLDHVMRAKFKLLHASCFLK